MTEFYVYKESFELRPTPFITGKHTAVVIEYKIRRRLQHFIMGFYLPCITCTCASWLQFWMDEKDIAGRAGVGTATVLAEIFLLEFSNQGMPKVGYLKAAEVFMVVSFVFIFSALVESAFVYKASSVILKPKIGDSQDEKNKGNTRSALENESSNKVITPAVSPPRLLCLETDHDISSCEEADNQPVESILPNKHVWPKHCFLEEKTPQRARSLGLMIDGGARVLFPLMYATFTVVYFALILCFRE
ncbi:gamma-aminobutyric acid receptor subunit alpha-3-like [Montipora capricornis]|uniref:gamma-aminobutyric acid receptor subunit alpha-3-like n=1 Tax=Montipora capricornis TaxID=246305 RepID=UPI0035F1A174